MDSSPSYFDSFRLECQEKLSIACRPLKVAQVSVHGNALELQRDRIGVGGCGRVGNLDARKTALAADVLHFAVADGSQIGSSTQLSPLSRPQSSLSLRLGEVRATRPED